MGETANMETKLPNAGMIVRFRKGTSSVEEIRIPKKHYRPSERFIQDPVHRHRRHHFEFVIEDQSLALELLADYSERAKAPATVRVLLAPSVHFLTEAETLIERIRLGYDALKELARDKFNEVVAEAGMISRAAGIDREDINDAADIAEAYRKAGLLVPITSQSKRRAPVIHVPARGRRDH
jgi:hypothetical protein